MDNSGNLDITANRRARKYGTSEMVRRVLWMPGRLVFLLIPRPFFAARAAWLRLFGARVGKRVHIYNSAHIYMPWNLEIGDDSAIGEQALIYNLGRVTIGKAVTISHRAHLCAGTHDYTDATLPLEKPPISIADQAWICADAFIAGGACIGEGAVIGARSVVVAHVPAMHVVAGNPARFVKTRVIRHAD